MSFASRNQTPQEKVNAEWDEMAGSWDDVANGFSAGLHAVLWSKIFGGGGNDESNDDDNDFEKEKKKKKLSTLTVLDFGCGTGLLTERLHTQVKHVLAIDAAPKMVELLQDKIQSREWDNVTAVGGNLADLANSNNNNDTTTSTEDNTTLRITLEPFWGKIDVIVASSVLNFVPSETLEATCQVLGQLLQPQTGVLFHVDWPTGDGQPTDGMTIEKAQHIYNLTGLVAQSTTVETLSMGKGRRGGGEEEGKPNDETTARVFFGLAGRSTSQSL